MEVQVITEIDFFTGKVLRVLGVADSAEGADKFIDIYYKDLPSTLHPTDEGEELVYRNKKGDSIVTLSEAFNVYDVGYDTIDYFL